MTRSKLGLSSRAGVPVALAIFAAADLIMFLLFPSLRGLLTGLFSLLICPTFGSAVVGQVNRLMGLGCLRLLLPMLWGLVWIGATILFCEINSFESSFSCLRKFWFMALFSAGLYTIGFFGGTLPARED